MTSRRDFILATSAVAFGLIARPAGAQPAPIVVGQVVDMSSINGEASRDFVAGARVLFDFVNSAGGVKGRSIRLVVRDDKGQVDNTLAQTRDLIEKESADVLFGYMGDAGIKAVVQSTLFKSSSIAFFGAASGLSVDSSINNIYFTRASYSAEAKTIIDQFKPLGIERYAVVAVHTAFHQGIAEEIARNIRAEGLTLTAQLSLDTAGAESEYQSAANEVAAKNAQVIIAVGDSLTTALFVKAYRPLNKGGWMVGLSMVNPTLLTQIVGTDAAHAMILTQVVPSLVSVTLPVAVEHRTLMKKYRDEPPSPLTFEGYIAAKSLVEALRLTNREPIRTEIVHSSRRLPKIDLGGIRIEFANGSNRGTQYADLAFLRKNGSLLQEDSRIFVLRAAGAGLKTAATMLS
jgi:ABC-type branched-subunit amino acid transport system substrate-binding protein